jgi:hypothetical protein
VHDGLTEQQLLMLAEMEAEEEEKHAVAEFKRRLDFNMGQVPTLVRVDALLLLETITRGTAFHGHCGCARHSVGSCQPCACFGRHGGHAEEACSCVVPHCMLWALSGPATQPHLVRVSMPVSAAQLAPGMQRESRITRAPRRPRDGWTLVVQPLSRRRNRVRTHTYGV